MTEEQFIEIFMKFFVSCSGWILGTSSVLLISMGIAGHLKKRARALRKEGLEFATLMIGAYSREWSPTFKIKVQSWLRLMMHIPKPEETKEDDKDAT
ncbi:hypothetical protein [uncultured Duncaniella sp.]|uniref:hypothetical protein n=1 Tax=uncultured Duncaniella sp. TaxID=2768039 RepID=UPI00260CF831|nr:hypothetical protein [uncultured Duncaniella sp.]